MAYFVNIAHSDPRQTKSEFPGLQIFLFINSFAKIILANSLKTLYNSFAMLLTGWMYAEYTNPEFLSGNYKTSMLVNTKNDRRNKNDIGYRLKT